MVTYQLKATYDTHKPLSTVESGGIVAMSSTTQSLTDRCITCNTEFDVLASTRPNHCSDACYFEDKGKHVLNQIQSDHTICSSCHKTLKRIEKPSDAYLARTEPIVSKAIIGFEYGTEHSTTGVDVREVEGTLPNEFTRLSCECGNVNPKNRIELLDELADGDPANRLFEALCRLEAKGAIDDRPDWNRLRDALNSGESLAYAIGQSIEA